MTDLSLRDKFEGFVTDLEAQLRSIDDAKVFAEGLLEYDRKLRVRENELNDKEKDLSKQRSEILSQIEYVKRGNSALDSRVKTVEIEHRKVIDALVVLDELKERKTEIESLEVSLSIKKEERESFNKENESLKTRSSLLEKERKTLNDRKEAIEIEELAINNEKQRLSRIATSMNT